MEENRKIQTAIASVLVVGIMMVLLFTMIN